MSILEKLRADHREAVTLLTTIISAVDEKERTILFKQFVQEFVAHNKAEEATLYEKLSRYEDSRFLALHAEEAHRLADALANELAADPRKSSERWPARCQVLKELVEHHARQEEDQIFAAAKATFDPQSLKEMGRVFEEEKKKHLR